MVTTQHGKALLLDEKLERDLEEIAAKAGRGADEIARQALRDYVDYTQRFLASVEAGLEDADAGRVFTAEEVRTQLAARRKLHGG